MYTAIWVTSQGLCGERVHQFEMFAILQYVVKLVIKPINFSPVARQPALTWQAPSAWAQMLPMYEEDTITQY